MRGSPGYASCATACWSTSTSRRSSPTHGSGAIASRPSAPNEPSPMSAQGHDNFSQSEVDKFDELAHRWWDPLGPQKALHALNPVRLDYVASRVELRDARVLDVGCGGGLLSEALAAKGA